ncbi:hypothetical protein JCM9140_3466 [Halalkalibacter wakoensis JCM 9140]|uniref:Prepilin-type N-terminal cleavage/methylation domain-containing protein n=1 Tax=Halalkalibacter wakoensis JCM 9140 TaxID=1236970 RepID=W4Q5R1_9BACI|nr:hypothetical protein [Halalkalibacter wakoensis]GAE27332.1 hypothetical protein JCM9140_3466 [Halalkalibacter wakoensis JCM 9140]
MKQIVKKQGGFALVEVLLTLVLFIIIITMGYGVLSTTISSSDKSYSYTNLRQEANLIITQVREEHQEGDEEKYILCYEDLLANNQLDFYELNVRNVSMDEGECVEIPRDEHLAVSFLLNDQHQNSYEIDTVIERGAGVSELEVSILQPNQEDFSDFIRDHNIFVYTNHVRITGANSSIKGEEATAVVNENFSSSNSANASYIETKDIYLFGNIEMKNFSFGNRLGTTSTVYIDGHIDIGSNSKIHGNLKHTGDENVDITKVTGTIEQVEIIDFPKLEMADLQDPSWYIQRDYQTSGPITNGTKFYGDDIKINHSVSDVIIVSTGDIDLLGGASVAGVLFAPNGKVTVRRSFTGVIIAETVEVLGNAEVTFEMLSEDKEFPF